MIKGNKVNLIPAAFGDRQKIYEWCFHSETTKAHSGPPDYPDIHIPTYEEFCSSDRSGYEEYYFTGARPDAGRGFIIINSGEPVGFISYCSFHLKPHISELDIWLNSEAHCGKGFGTDAIIAFGEYLNKNRGIRELIMRPSIKNVRAVKSYEKAGFRKSDKRPEEYLREEYISIYGDGDYGIDESALLVKTYSSGGVMSDILKFPDRAAFRAWLEINGESSGGVWLLFGKKGGPAALSANDALEEALCFGWIDGQMQSIDDKTYKKYFSACRANSKWSDKNKALAGRLEKQGLMTGCGRAKIEEAKENGGWDKPKAPPITDEQTALLSDLLKEHEPAYTNFQAMPPSVKKTYTRAYFDAKTDAGRASRIAWMVERLNKNLKPM